VGEIDPMTECGRIDSEPSKTAQDLAQRIFARGQWAIQCAAKQAALVRCVQLHNERTP